MNNFEKMVELAGETTKEKIIQWAYHNRVTVSIMAYDEPFEVMEYSVDSFIQTEAYQNEVDEHRLWALFLDAPYLEEG